MAKVTAKAYTLSYSDHGVSVVRSAGFVPHNLDALISAAELISGEARIAFRQCENVTVVLSTFYDDGTERIQDATQIMRRIYGM